MAQSKPKLTYVVGTWFCTRPTEDGVVIYGVGTTAPEAYKDYAWRYEARMLFETILLEKWLSGK